MREGRGKKKRRNKERREARKEMGGRKEGGRGPFPKRLNSVPQVLGSIFVHQCPLPGSLLPAPMDTSHLEATPGDGPGEMNLVTLLDPLLSHCCPLLLHTCLGTLASVGHSVTCLLWSSHSCVTINSGEFYSSFSLWTATF